MVKFLIAIFAFLSLTLLIPIFSKTDVSPTGSSSVASTVTMNHIPIEKNVRP